MKLGAGVRVVKVAMKPGNAGGAKGDREEETVWTHGRKKNRREFPRGINKPEK
jgi:hypothetical protein